MNKLYFLWLQKIANINNNLNVQVYENKEIKSYLKKVFNNEMDNKFELEKIGFDESIINNILDKNIKEEIATLYDKIIDFKYEIITIEDEKYPRCLLGNDMDIPFCYITNCKVNLNNKNIYLYYDSYYTKFAKNLIVYFGRIITENKCNIFSEYNSNKLQKIDILSCDMFESIYISNSNVVILPNNKYIYNFKYSIISALILIEAKYEKEIVEIVDYLLKINKDIYVVPSNIFRENSYFSNYLIKQGADIILNKWDLKFILSNIIS